MHKIKFEDTEEGRKRYELCYQSIALVPGNHSVPVADWDDVVGLVKKLKAIGVESKDRIGTHHLYDLQEGGGEVTLERSEMKQLIGFVSLPIWRPLTIEDALQLKKWLEAIPKDRGSLKLDARPEAKRIAEAGGGSEETGATRNAS